MAGNDDPTIHGNRVRGLMRSRPEAVAQKFLWKARNPARGCALVLAERALRPSEFARPRSRRVAGIEVGRRFLLALFRHHRGARAALFTAPAQTLLRDVVLARPAVFPSLTDESLLANGLSHSLRPCELRRCACRRYVGTRAHSYPAWAAADRASDGEVTGFGVRRLYGAIPSIDILQCRVPPSPLRYAT